MTILSKTSAITAAAGLAFTSIATQAGTRAEGSPVVIDLSRDSALASDPNEIVEIDHALFFFLLALLLQGPVSIDNRGRG